MKASWYEKQGAARHVLIVGEMDDPQSGAGELALESQPEYARWRCKL